MFCIGKNIFSHRKTKTSATQHSCHATSIHLHVNINIGHDFYGLGAVFLLERLKERFFLLERLKEPAKLVSACFSLLLNNNWQDLLQVLNVC